MDYHVFIISRIRETFDRGAKMDDAVAHGIKSTAGVVTSAAIVMVCVFAVFATLSIPFFKQFGVGLAVAILLDATIVRGVLLPATMKLLGEWNWYLPKWLEWLPRLEPLRARARARARRRAAGSARSEARSGARSALARITGLVLVVLVALGLAYLKFAPSGKAVSVPAGAKAGQLTLHPCHYGTEKGSYAADCGTLVVRENRHDAQSRLIALPVTRIHARSAHPGEPIFRLQGGPGITNMTFPDASRFAEQARRRARRLPRRRRLVEARLPGGRVGAQAQRLPDAEVVPRGRGGVQGVRRSAAASPASTSPATRSRSASTISTPRAARSATSRSISSARAPERARR